MEFLLPHQGKAHQAVTTGRKEGNTINFWKSREEAQLSCPTTNAVACKNGSSVGICSARCMHVLACLHAQSVLTDKNICFGAQCVVGWVPSEERNREKKGLNCLSLSLPLSPTEVTRRRWESWGSHSRKRKKKQQFLISQIIVQQFLFFLLPPPPFHHKEQYCGQNLPFKAATKRGEGEESMLFYTFLPPCFCPRASRSKCTRNSVLLFSFPFAPRRSELGRVKNLPNQTTHS